VSRLLARIRRDESGFTLPELLVAMIIGIIVVLSTFLTLDSSIALTGKVTERVDRTQRARSAMDRITRDLSSQVCLDSTTPAIISADDYSIRFYSFFGDNPFVPDIRQLSWDTNTNTITEKTWAGSGTMPNTTWPAQPRTSTILTDVAPVFTSGNSGPRGPLFKYYLSGSSTPLPTPLSAANMAAAAQISISFMAYAQGRNMTGPAETMQNQVFVRTADPSAPVATPNCS
jgi:prepilin-type N-terminal cleavage/methylation domain-containing protein